MKAVKKYMAVMMSIFMIAGVMPATVYASPEEADVEAVITEEPSILYVDGSSKETTDAIEEEVPEEIVGAESTGR